MILRISIENFRSFKSPTEIVFVPDKSPELKENILRGKNRSDIGALKSALIYGPNASGKSNIVKAVQTLKILVVGNSGESKKLPYTPFRLCNTANKANTTLEIEFKAKGKCFAYGIVYNQDKIIEEWLYRITKTSDTLIFERNGKELKFANSILDTKENRPVLSQLHILLSEKTGVLWQCNESALWTKLDGLEDLQTAYHWFSSTLRIIYPESPYVGLGFDIQDSDAFRKGFHHLLELFDTGIAQLNLKKLSLDDQEIPSFIRNLIEEEKQDEFSFIAGIGNSNDRYYVRKKKDDDIRIDRMETIHKTDSFGECTFSLKDESDGTLRLFDLIPGLMELMTDDKVFVIDEIERSLHPQITAKLFKLFHQLSKESGQLIATTHETELMTKDMFRKDQLWFTQKESDGTTTLHSMNEYKVRNDTNFRKNYLLGRFGALPILKEYKTHSEERAPNASPA